MKFVAWARKYLLYTVTEAVLVSTKEKFEINWPGAWNVTKHLFSWGPGQKDRFRTNFPSNTFRTSPDFPDFEIQQKYDQFPFYNAKNTTYK